LSVSQCSFSTFWPAENAISAHSSTCLIRKIFWIYLYWDSKYLQILHLCHCKLRKL